MRKITFILLAVLLFSTFSVYAQEEETAEIVEGGDIAPGDVMTGEFETGSRVRYVFTAESDMTVNIYLDGKGLDTYLRVFEEDGTEPLAENDDRGDGTVFSTIEGVELAEGDVLWIDAGTFGDTGEGAYRLSLVDAEVGLPELTVEEGGEIESGAEVTGELAENTRVRYTLTAEETTAVSIQTAGDLDTYLRLYVEGEEGQINESDDIGDSLNAGIENLAIPAGTTLEIEVAGFNDNAEGEYTLNVEDVTANMPETREVMELGDQTPEEVCENAEIQEEPVRMQYVAPEEVLEEGVDYLAVFCTGSGPILIDLFEEETPITVNSFVFLATNGFYDQTTFHRVIEDFMAQGGDPLGLGIGGPGYEFVNEIVEELAYDEPGKLGMANAGPDTNGSQFFITVEPVERLTGSYTIFGEVVEGQENVESIELRDPQTATEPGTSLDTVVIVSQ